MISALNPGLLTSQQSMSVSTMNRIGRAETEFCEVHGSPDNRRPRTPVGDEWAWVRELLKSVNELSSVVSLIGSSNICRRLRR